MKGCTTHTTEIEATRQLAGKGDEAKVQAGIIIPADCAYRLRQDYRRLERLDSSLSSDSDRYVAVVSDRWAEVIRTATEPYTIRNGGMVAWAWVTTGRAWIPGDLNNGRGDASAMIDGREYAICAYILDWRGRVWF